MNFFITGATGKVGSRFVPRMLQRGHRVKVLVRDATKADWLQQQGAEQVEGDLLQPESYSNALRGMDAVIHLAAQFRGVDDETARRSNLDGSIALAHAVLQAEVPTFVFISTNNVYGSGNRARPNREEDALNPAFAYPQTKAAAEAALMELHRDKGLGLRIVRLPFVYGDRDPHINEFLPYMHNWHPAKRLHMAHHADVAQALLLAATIPGKDGRIYNVGDDAPISIAELAMLHQHALPSSSASNDYDPWDMVVDTTRIREELNYRPIYPSFYAARDAGAI